MTDRLIRRFLVALALVALALVVNGCLLGPGEDEVAEETQPDPKTETGEESLTQGEETSEEGYASNPSARNGKSDQGESGSPPPNLPGHIEEGDPGAEKCDTESGGGEFDPAPNCDDSQGDGVGHGSPQPLDPQAPDDSPDDNDEAEED